MTPLEKIIRDTIDADGPMPLNEYMALCLGHPEHGYYMTRDPLGQQGDFTTAPEISQMFGELIGAWIADSWEKMGSPSRFILLECGPGRGTLMRDALRVTKAETRFHEALELHFLETSPVLKDKQKQALDGYDATWYTDLDSLPTNAPVIIIGNEFLDALPVTQLVKNDTGWNEIFVENNKNSSFRLCEKAAKNNQIGLIPPLLIQPKAGEQVEVSLERKELINKLINIITNQSGMSLFIDYGFTHNVAGETLQAVKNHAYCNIFDTPGEADLTAHVNFAEISHMAMLKNLTVHGTVSQSNFLKRLGIDVRANQLTQNATDQQKSDIQSALTRLTGTSDKRAEMGELFKVIAFSSDPSIQLAGF